MKPMTVDGTLPTTHTLSLCLNVAVGFRVILRTSGVQYLSLSGFCPERQVIESRLGFPHSEDSDRCFVALSKNVKGNEE